MSIKIDWYTFSFETVPAPQDQDRMFILGDGLCAILSAQTIIAMRPWKWEPLGYGRAPYTEGYTVKGTGITIWANPALKHATFEASGRGCEELRDAQILDDIIRETAHRATRIDIAVDISTATTPTQFVGAGVTGRMKTRSYLTSAAGDTVYIGSQKSDCYARVYRYNPPHPRADKLRVEHVHRREKAKDMAARWAIAGAEACKSSLWDTYRWKHSDWTHTSVIDPLRRNLVSDARSASGTIRWLVGQAAPAFRRLVADGSIPDPETFIAEYFLRD